MSNTENNKWVNLIYELAAFLGGSCLFAIGMNMFLTPGSVIMGGITGIASTLNYFFPVIPIGIAIICLNLPLILINMKVAGLNSMIRTIIGIAGSSIFMDLFSMIPPDIMPRSTADPLLCGLLGGFCMGAASGIYLTRGFTNGGSDLASYMLKRKFKRLSTGRFIFIIDVVIITGSALITQRFNGILPSAISIFAYSTAVDMVLGGADKAKMMYIISEKYQQIADLINQHFTRGVTVLYGRGWYTKEDKFVLMCVIKRSEEFRIRTVVKSIDPDAFMIMSDANEVIGYGFKSSDA